MATINIDGKDYNTEEMNDEALAQLQAVQFTSNEIVTTQLRLAALQTAKNTYAKALKSMLDGQSQDNEASDIDIPENLTFD